MVRIAWCWALEQGTRKATAPAGGESGGCRWPQHALRGWAGTSGQGGFEPLRFTFPHPEFPKLRTKGHCQFVSEARAAPIPVRAKW